MGEPLFIEKVGVNLPNISLGLGQGALNGENMFFGGRMYLVLPSNLEVWRGEFEGTSSLLNH